MTNEFDLNKHIKGLKRQTELTKWLGGSGPYTPEEEEIKKKFGGKNANLLAQQTIALHRKTQTMLSLSGDNDLSEEEQKTINSLGGESKDLVGRAIVGLKRKTRLIKYLSGDEDEDLSK